MFLPQDGTHPPSKMEKMEKVQLNTQQSIIRSTIMAGVSSLKGTILM